MSVMRTFTHVHTFIRTPSLIHTGLRPLRSSKGNHFFKRCKAALALVTLFFVHFSMASQATNSRQNPMTMDALSITISATDTQLIAKWEPLSGKHFSDIALVQKEIRYWDGKLDSEERIALKPDQTTSNINGRPLTKYEFHLSATDKNGLSVIGPSVTANYPHPNIVLDNLDGRPLYIFRPEGYENTKNLPVIYAQDGQNLFSPASSKGDEWKLDELINRLVKNDKLEPTAVVGIGSIQTRNIDFYARAMGYPEGQGEAYGEWVVTKLLPYIEKHYSLSNKKAHRAVLGSSYGATASLYLGATYPEIFSTVAALSPAMDFGGAEYLEKNAKPSQRYYVDAGEKEFYEILHPDAYDFVHGTRDLVRKFNRAGFKYGENLFYLEAPKAEDHRESYVRERLDIPLLLFKGKENSRKVSHMDFFLSQPNNLKDQTHYIAYANAIVHLDNGLRFTGLDACEYHPTSGKIDEEGRLTLFQVGSSIRITCNNIEQEFSLTTE